MTATDDPRELIRAIGGVVRRHSVQGSTVTPVPRLMLHRSERPLAPMQQMHRPSLCVVLQGEKRAIFGGSVFPYGVETYLVVALDMPLFSEVVAADRERPYLGLALELDTAALSSLIVEMGDGASDAAPMSSLQLSPVGPDLLRPLLRLVELLERPADLPILGASIEREILFRILQGPQACVLRHLANRESRVARIAAAAAFIRERFNEPIRVEALARLAGMSVSTFHQHFRRVNSVSPIQYQKLVRLHEARRLLMTGSRDIAKVGFTVGYDNPSQFSREYRRQFGFSPREDEPRLRGL